MTRRVKNLSEDCLSSHYYTLKKIKYKYQKNNGEWTSHTREIYDRGNGAAILLYNSEKKKIVLTRQFRIPTYLNGNEEGLLIEVCAGQLDRDSPKDCIIRETEEETGYRVKNVTKVYEAYMSPGSVTEKLHFYIAQYEDHMKVSDGGGVDHEQEDIEVMEIDFEKAIDMISSGQIQDAKTIILLQYAILNNLIG